ncbi:MAG: DUF1819 family protein [Candidatus Wallbacteria bacterium]
MKTNHKYRMSFTTGGLFLRESIKCAELYAASCDWEKTRDEVISGNILQARTISSSKRIFGEISGRLQTLNDEEMDFLLNSARNEQCFMLWTAVCRYYPFIREFAVEVIREKFLAFRSNLTPEDFNAFFFSKADLNPALEKITVQSRNKLRQVLFKILREADLIDKTNNITQPILTSGFINIITRGKSLETSDLLIFPVHF